MENIKARKKLFNRFAILLVAFLGIGLLTIGGFYNGKFMGLQLNSLVYVLAAIELILFAVMMKLIMDEESLERASHTA